jgi:hypothetical protein
MQPDDRCRLQLWSGLAALIGVMCLMSDFASARSQTHNRPDASELSDADRFHLDGQRVFVLEPREILRRRPFCGECDRQDWQGVFVLSATVKAKIRAFPQGRQYVPRGPWYGRHSRRHRSTT